MNKLNIAEQAPLTSAEVHALAAVANGEVVRIYRANGNVLKGPRGVGSTVLWSLDRRRLITDGAETTGAYERKCQQVLTAAGRRIFDTSAK